MRLGVDVGTVRVGVAMSDPHGMLATPVTTLARNRGRRTPTLGGARGAGRGTRGGGSGGGSARRPCAASDGPAVTAARAYGSRAGRADRTGARGLRRRAADHRVRGPAADRGRGPRKGAGARWSTRSPPSGSCRTGWTSWPAAAQRERRPRHFRPGARGDRRRRRRRAQRAALAAPAPDDPTRDDDAAPEPELDRRRSAPQPPAAGTAGGWSSRSSSCWSSWPA